MRFFDAIDTEERRVASESLRSTESDDVSTFAGAGSEEIRSGPIPEIAPFYLFQRLTSRCHLLASLAEIRAHRRGEK